jgi:hypothetical protein
MKSELSTLSSLDKEESRPTPGRWFDRVAVRFAILFRVARLKSCDYGVRDFVVDRL